MVGTSVRDEVLSVTVTKFEKTAMLAGVAAVPSMAASQAVGAALAKKLNKALEQLADEGVVQIFRPLDGSPPVIGVVGLLQIDVLQSRLKVEYGVPASFEHTQWEYLRWVTSEDRDAVTRFSQFNRSELAEDHDGELVALFTSDWRRKRAEEEWKMLRFHALREQHSLSENK